MKVNATGLEFEISPHSTADSEGWSKVKVDVRANGFNGCILACIQIEDILRFEHELQRMIESVGKNAIARLCSAEPDIDIQLKMNKQGHIYGIYAIESERRDGVPTVLSGSLEMDQSFIPQMIEDLHILVSALK